MAIETFKRGAGDPTIFGGGTTESHAGKSTRDTARYGDIGSSSTKVANWGAGASRSVYNVFTNSGDNDARQRDLLSSRLWKGVPQLSEEMIRAFEAAYTGHTFIFITTMPRFMTQGIYADTNMHQHAKNIKSIIENASTGFSGPSNMVMEFGEQQDGNGRKLSHPTRVTKEQTDVTIRLHEFAGLPLKNGIEAWMTGVYDHKSGHGHYHGNLGIPGGWSNYNHTMAMLVVQTDPTWTEIQDAAYYYNMMPIEVPFDSFNWTKGEYNIVDDYDLTFRCNEERSPAIMYAAEKYMNARILSMVQTSAFNSRQFVVSTFSNGEVVGDLSTDTASVERISDGHNYNYNVSVNGNQVSDAYTAKWTQNNNGLSVNISDKREADYKDADDSTDSAN